jgi:hypothetical protein
LFFGNLLDVHPTPRLVEQLVIQARVEVNIDLLQCAGMGDESERNGDLMCVNVLPQRLNVFSPTRL